MEKAQGEEWRAGPMKEMRVRAWKMDKIKDCGAVKETMEDRVAIAEPGAKWATMVELVMTTTVEQ